MNVTEMMGSISCCVCGGGSNDTSRFNQVNLIRTEEDDDDD